MSLYTALTQVLAPFAAKIKGIQTGYDGTEYENPGEAVREQINDLHVLIGDVPGTAIQASAVAYGDSDVGTELTNVNGRLDNDFVPIYNLLNHSDNLMNQNIISEGENITFNGTEFVGTALAFKTAFTPTNPVPIDISDTTIRYTLTFEAYTEAVGQTNNGLKVCFVYDNGTTGTINVSNATTSYTKFTATTSAVLPIKLVGIYFDYANGANNIWHIKNFMLVKGTTAEDYEPYNNFVVIDDSARETANNSLISANNANTEIGKLNDYSLPIIENSIADIRSNQSGNLVNQNTIAHGSGITFDGNEFIGKASAFSSAFPKTNPLSVDITDDTIRYTLSFEAYTEAVEGSGNGLQVLFLYSDNTTGTINVPNSTTSYTKFSATSTSSLPKLLVGIYFSYGSSASNVWHIKNIMLNAGTSASAYIPYYTAFDRVARSEVNSLDIRKTENSFFSKGYMRNGRIKFAMHRGYITENEAYENSVPSFTNAGIAQAWGCETDIRTTSDGIMVCIHDNDISRTTNGTGNVSEMTYAMLSQYNLKDSGGNVSQYTVPTFKEYLRICKTYSMVALIEIKNVSDLDAFFALIESEKMTDMCIITCGLYLLKQIRTRNVTIPLQFNKYSTDESYTDIITTLSNSGYCNLGIAYENGNLLTEAIIEMCHNADIFVCVWTINSQNVAKNIFGYSADYIVTETLTRLTI